MGKTYIIAEAGVNHNGDIQKAKLLIDIAVKAKVNAVKFQTFITENVISIHAPKAEYQLTNTGSENSQYEMVKQLELGFEQFRELKLYSENQGIDFLSTPFDIESADFLIDELKLTVIKIPSGEITNAPLIYHIAKKKVKIILSTGMSTLGEIEQALSVIAYGYLGNDELPSIQAFKEAYISVEGQAKLREKVTLLHCTTEYPAPIREVNLNVMHTLQKSFDLNVGYSDHTEGITVPIAAVALGAVILEKHITYDKHAEGPDHIASLSPNELEEMVVSIRKVEESLGSTIKMPTTSEIKNIVIARKSITAQKEISKNELFSEENITIKRPGSGVSPFCYWELLNTSSSKKYEVDEKIDKNDSY